MPITIKDLKGGLGNIITGWGVITEQEFIEVFKRHLTQGKDKFGMYRYSLNDFTAVTEANFSIEAIHQIADLCIRAAENNREAIVATAASNDLTFGLSRMTDALRFETGWDQETFRDRQDAEDWIKERAKKRFGIENVTFD